MLPQSDTDQNTKRGIGSWVRITGFRKLSVSVFWIEECPNDSLFPGPLGGIMHEVPVLKSLPGQYYLQHSSRAWAHEIWKLG